MLTGFVRMLTSPVSAVFSAIRPGPVKGEQRSLVGPAPVEAPWSPLDEVILEGLYPADLIYADHLRGQGFSDRAIAEHMGYDRAVELFQNPEDEFVSDPLDIIYALSLYEQGHGIRSIAVHLGYSPTPANLQRLSDALSPGDSE